MTREGFFQYYESRRARYADAGNDPNQFMIDKLCSKGVVNAGESYIGYEGTNGTEWADWADVTQTLKEKNVSEHIDFFTYDNFPIRSYPETEAFTAANVLTEPQETYAAGEKIHGRLAIQNNTEIDFSDDTEFELILSMGASGEEVSAAKITSLKSGELYPIDYAYTVKQADIKAGKVVSTLKIRVNGQDVDYDPIFGDTLSVTVKTVNSYVIGDADVDGVITINDATAIQMKLADIPQDFFDAKAADVDEKGLTIMDVTYIQRYLAEYNDHNHIGKTIIRDKYELPFVPV